MNATAEPPVAAVPAVVPPSSTPAAPPTARDIESWTPAQQMETLGHLASVVLARQPEGVSIPAPAEAAPLGFTLRRKHAAWIRRKEDFTPEERALHEYASDPRNLMPLTDEMVNRILDAIPDESAEASSRSEAA